MVGSVCASKTSPSFTAQAPFESLAEFRRIPNGASVVGAPFIKKLTGNEFRLRKLDASRRIEPLRTARARTNSSSYILQPSPAIFASRILPDINCIIMRNAAIAIWKLQSDLGALRRGLMQKPRRVSPLQRRNRLNLFSAAACTSPKILLA